MTNKIFIFLAMIFMHILDDYRLQGILASMKQKEWWKKQEQYKELYKYDYLVALIMHSFSWTFMVMLPLAFTMSFQLNSLFLICFCVNVMVHAIVDDLKANKMKINLWVDQVVHLLQVALTATIFL